MNRLWKQGRFFCFEYVDGCYIYAALTAKYQNKYRIASARAEWWNYGWNGAYFITICTHDQFPYFGTIHRDKMELWGAGVIADLCWYQIPQRNPGVELGPFVIMPNHMHGILILNRPDNDDVQTLHATSPPIQTLHATSLQSDISPKPSSVPAIVRSYKSAVQMNCNRLGLPMNWQTRYWDNIIRSANDFEKIAMYIQKNPELWKRDIFK